MVKRRGRTIRKPRAKRTRRPGPVMFRRRGIMPRLGSGSMLVKRKFWTTSWFPAPTATGDFWRQFSLTLSAVPNSTDVTNLFDQYKIAAIKWTLFPRFTGFSGNDNTDTTIPGVTNIGQTSVHVCYDNYSTTAITGTYVSATFNNFLEQGRVKSITNPNRPINIYMKPTIQGNYIGGTATNMFTRAKWLPTSSTGVAHYGPNVFVADANFAGLFGNQYDILVTAYIMCRNLK